MRKTALVLALLLLAPPAAAATPLAFGLPAQVGGEVTVRRATQVLLLFEPDLGSAGVADLESAENAGINHTETHVHVAARGIGGFHPTMPPRDSKTPGGSGVRASFSRPGAASLYIEAASVTLRVGGQELNVDSQATASGADVGWSTQDDFLRPYRLDHMVPADSVSLERAWGGTAFDYSLEARGVRLVEWFNADVQCDEPPCPSGGGAATTSIVSMPGRQVMAVEMAWQDVLPRGAATLTSSGRVTGLLAANREVDVSVQGWMRLPLASSTDCPSCHGPRNQTLYANGTLALTGLHREGDGLAARLDGYVSAARFDEAPADGASLLGLPGAEAALAIGGATAVFLLGKLALVLFTRIRDPLHNPRRRAILDYVKGHPGANFREVVRETHVAAGTARHHLGILKRSALLVEHRHGATTRFFENHGKFTHAWNHVVALRDPDLAALHAFLGTHGDMMQREVLDAMQAHHSWSRSTTQHRLARLQREGLVTIRSQGRRRIYGVPAGAEKAAMGHAPGSGLRSSG